MTRLTFPSIVPLALGAGALGFFAVKVASFTSSPGATALLVGLMALVLVGSLASALLDGTGWPVRILVAQAMVAFLTTAAEPDLLPVRWFLHGAILTQACLVLPAWGQVLAGLFVGTELVVVTHFIPDMTLGRPDPAATAAALGLIVAAGATVGRLKAAENRFRAERERNDRLHASVLQLTSANTEFLEQATTAGELSAIEERHRITRDLHDVVGQTLTNIIMMMDASLHRKTEDPDEIAKLFRWVRSQAQTGLEETRRVLYELRSIKPPAIRGVKALKRLVETFGKLSRIKTVVHWGNLPWTFDPAQEKAVHHLIQSSLSNAFRHGSATQIDVHFQVQDGVLDIMVRDNGKGGAVGEGGIGQKGMAERLAPWGGTVTFRSEPFGYVVLATLPFREAADADQDSDR